MAIREHEIYLPMVSLEGNKYSDTGYRFRKNTFYRTDEWYPFYQSDQEQFYDTTVYNSDTFLVDDNNLFLGELYFRLETEEVTHHRIVKQLIDLIGVIGGLQRFLLQIANIIMGGYLTFNASIKVMNGLYFTHSYTVCCGQ